MSKSTWLLVAQGLGITLQMVNLGIGTVTHDAGVALITGAFVSGYQFVIQHIGNQTPPSLPGTRA